MSRGAPYRFRGTIKDSICSSRSSMAGGMDLIMSVRTIAGVMTLTLIPLGASFLAAVLVTAYY